MGAVVADGGSVPEVRSGIAGTVAVLAGLGIVWDDGGVDLSSGVGLLCSLVMSIFLYSCEAWALAEEVKRRMRTVGVGVFGRLLGVSCRGHIAGGGGGVRRDSEDHWTLQGGGVAQSGVVWACRGGFRACRGAVPGGGGGGGGQRGR